MKWILILAALALMVSPAFAQSVNFTNGDFNSIRPYSNITNPSFEVTQNDSSGGRNNPNNLTIPTDWFRSQDPSEDVGAAYCNADNASWSNSVVLLNSTYKVDGSYSIELFDGAYICQHYVSNGTGGVITLYIDWTNADTANMQQIRLYSVEPDVVDIVYSNSSLEGEVCQFESCVIEDYSGNWKKVTLRYPANIYGFQLSISLGDSDEVPDKIYFDNITIVPDKMAENWYMSSGCEANLNADTVNWTTYFGFVNTSAGNVMQLGDDPSGCDQADLYHAPFVANTSQPINITYYVNMNDADPLLDSYGQAGQGFWVYLAGNVDSYQFGLNKTGSIYSNSGAPNYITTQDVGSGWWKVNFEVNVTDENLSLYFETSDWNDMLNYYLLDNVSVYNPSEPAPPIPIPVIGTFALSPSSGSHTVGTPFTVNVTADSGGINIDGIDALLTYDSSKLSVTGLTMVDGLTNITFQNYTSSTITFSKLAAFGTQEAVNDTVATITFMPTAAGNASVDFLFTLGNTTDSNMAVNGTDMLNSTTNGVYEISEAPPVPPITGGVTGVTGTAANAVILIFGLVAAMIGMFLMYSGVKSQDAKMIVYGFVIFIVNIIFMGIMSGAINA